MENLVTTSLGLCMIWLGTKVGIRVISMKKKVHNQQESTGKKGRYSYIKARKNNQVLPKAMLSTIHHIGVLLKQANHGKRRIFRWIGFEYGFGNVFG